MGLSDRDDPQRWAVVTLPLREQHLLTIGAAFQLARLLSLDYRRTYGFPVDNVVLRARSGVELQVAGLPHAADAIGHTYSAEALGMDRVPGTPGEWPRVRVWIRWLSNVPGWVIEGLADGSLGVGIWDDVVVAPKLADPMFEGHTIMTGFRRPPTLNVVMVASVPQVGDPY